MPTWKFLTLSLFLDSRTRESPTDRVQKPFISGKRGCMIKDNHFFMFLNGGKFLSLEDPYFVGFVDVVWLFVFSKFSILLFSLHIL